MYTRRLLYLLPAALYAVQCAFPRSYVELWRLRDPEGVYLIEDPRAIWELRMIMNAMKLSPEQTQKLHFYRVPRRSGTLGSLMGPQGGVVLLAPRVAEALGSGYRNPELEAFSTSSPFLFPPQPHQFLSSTQVEGHLEPLGRAAVVGHELAHQLLHHPAYVFGSLLICGLLFGYSVSRANSKIKPLTKNLLLGGAFGSYLALRRNLEVGADKYSCRHLGPYVTVAAFQLNAGQRIARERRYEEASTWGKLKMHLLDIAPMNLCHIPASTREKVLREELLQMGLEVEIQGIKYHR